MTDNLLNPGLPPPDSEDHESMPLATLLMLGGLVVAALGFTVFGIGFGLGWWSDAAAPEDDLAAAETAGAVEPAPTAPEPDPIAALPGAELTPGLDPNAAAVEHEPVDGPLPGAEPVPEIEPAGGARTGGGSAGGGSGGGGAKGGGGKWTGQRVSVTLVLKHYDHVEVELGGKVFSLDGDKTVKIRPGGYRIQLRKRADAPWKPAGLVDIAAGSSYRVTLLDPPFAKLETLP
ncbi:hypothetical protein ENSA5_13970 [Enhygromyxa salina]|uniref:Uncharacterized protein n=1 Tax=Enhygromyxa salina TaxID=215803 RepID=A0A2S9YF24_9BACT|nr:hypothetical protein [Enhygromyxa salina]PRQ03642.1 hypothetical protein ENSA5_13970 [Enhygromyxa salina]